MRLTLVNGEQREHVSVSNRGLAYGDGVFTTVKVIQQRPQLWAAHRRRLARDCAKLALTFDAAALEREAAGLCAEMSSLAVLKIILTRGEGERGYRPPAGDAVRILQAAPLTPPPSAYLERGVAVTVCKLRLSDTPALAGVKHLNRLEQVLARAEWGDEYQEGLMLDADGHVVEGTMSNLFVVRGDELLTPMLDRCGVAGVMRERIIAGADRVRETRLRLDDLYRAEGVFICNAVIDAWPVARIGDKDCAATGFIAGRFNAVLALAAGGGDE